PLPSGEVRAAAAAAQGAIDELDPRRVEERGQGLAPSPLAVRAVSAAVADRGVADQEQRGPASRGRRRRGGWRGVGRHILAVSARGEEREERGDHARSPQGRVVTGAPEKSRTAAQSIATPIARSTPRWTSSSNT